MSPSFNIRIVVNDNITTTNNANNTKLNSTLDPSSQNNSASNIPYFKVVYGNVRGSYPTYRVDNTIGVAVIVAVTVVVLILVVVLIFIGFVCFRRFKGK